MKLGKVEFCHFLQLIALVLCFSGMSQAELSRSSSKPYFQSGRSRTKRSWVWNQFFVLEEYMGSDPLYVGKVGHVVFQSHLWLLGMSLVGWRTAPLCFGVREHETFTLLPLNYEQLKPTLSRGGLVLMDFLRFAFNFFSSLKLIWTEVRSDTNSTNSEQFVVHFFGGQVGTKLSFIFHSSVLFGRIFSFECLLTEGPIRRMAFPSTWSYQV